MSRRRVGRCPHIYVSISALAHSFMSANIATIPQSLGFRTPDDDEERESVMHKIILEYADLTDDIATSSRAAMRQLMIAATGAQRKHVIQNYRHGRQVVEDQSMPLEQRLLEVSFPYHDPRKTEVPMGDMDDIGILFWPLHAALRGLPAVQMMENLTKAALKATKFHEVFAKKFLLQCNPPWYERSRAEKYEYFRKWFLSKFSLDLKNECMLPRPGERRKTRNGAAWLGVEITDQEMEQILDDSFSLYCANRT
jgi:hypothetical protein